MTPSTWSSFLFAMAILTHAIDANTKLIINTTNDQTAGSPITPTSFNSKELGHGLRRRLGGYKEGLNAMQLSKRPCHFVIQTQYDRPELEGLSPVRVEMGPREKRNRAGLRKRHFPGLGCSELERKTVTPHREITANSKSHHTGYRELKRQMSPALNERSEAVSEILPFLPRLLKPAVVPLHLKSTLLIPLSPSHAETQQFSKKKGSQETMAPKEAVSCDHHLDCVPEVQVLVTDGEFCNVGSCCNLRKHTCDLHNRGLNNKCYDDCMCEEGLCCFSSYHHNHPNVIQKKGRCVDPKYINTNHGTLTAI
ncbi:hypothetical protein NFI96_028378 [Prochilodus magdalenae]|nr:hypothetical protein NFI96_028378 [Prochilodus magdalenae]